jgi:2-keto-4-pentenoate hydratase/2-oxohepta-3-ene-1,7-dioic acid hydratase in catechol pathway
MYYVNIKNQTDPVTVGKIFCLGRNYSEHAKEMDSEVPDSPLVFIKPATAIIHDGQPIVRPAFSKLLHHEVELYVAIGRGGKNISLTESSKHILGYGVALDMTLRDIQNQSKKEGLPWTVCKGFDTSAPVSDIIPIGDIPDPYQLEIRCSVNGKERQHSSTGKMIFKINRIIEYISSIFTLEEGDLIFTGTPEGVGEVKPGDVIQAELVGFITITHPVQNS